MKHILLTLSIVLLAIGCQTPQQKEEAPEAPIKPIVVAANYPLHYFAERIAGDLVDLQFPIAPGGDPAFWKPGEEDVQVLQQADIVLLNGADYSKWLESISLPSGRLVNTSEAFKDEYIVSQGKTHSHGGGDEHSHGETAFTTWLDMGNASKQAMAVRDALTKLLPESEQTLSQNYETLAADLAELDLRLKNAASAYQGTTLMGSHPVYQYLAKAYDLEIRAFHLEPGVALTGHDLGHIQAVVNKRNATIMLWEGDPLADSKTKLESIGVQSIVFSPCGNRPEKGDWLSTMNKNVSALASPN